MQSKRKTYFVIDVHLIDTGQVNFRRVLGRRDIAVLVIEDIEAGV